LVACFEMFNVPAACAPSFPPCFDGMTTISRLFQFFSTFLLLTSFVFPTAVSSSSQTRVHASIAHFLDSGTFAGGALHVVIRLHEPALQPLSLPPHLPRSQAREAVALHLQHHRRSAQDAVREQLSSSSCEFFWITNRISCRNTTQATLRVLALHPDVASIHPPSAFHRPRPMLGATPPISSNDNPQPNIHQVFAFRLHHCGFQLQYIYACVYKRINSTGSSSDRRRCSVVSVPGPRCYNRSDRRRRTLHARGAAAVVQRQRWGCGRRRP
jgi:hypothetical protein